MRGLLAQALVVELYRGTIRMTNLVSRLRDAVPCEEHHTDLLDEAADGIEQMTRDIETGFMPGAYARLKELQEIERKYLERSAHEPAVTKTVTRYEMLTDSDGVIEPDPCDYGTWVRYDDIKHLLAHEPADGIPDADAESLDWCKDDFAAGRNSK